MTSAWTTERPTEPGTYWLRLGADDTDPNCVRVIGDGDDYAIEEPGCSGWVPFRELYRPDDDGVPPWQWQRAEPRP